MMRSIGLMLGLGLLFMAGGSSGIDLNGDGMSDVWQQVYSVPSADANTDYNGTGLTNVQKSSLGVDPRSVNAVFAVQTPVLDTANNELRLSFSSVAGKIYRAESTTDFVTWSQIDPAVTAMNEQTTIVTTMPDPAVTNLFFRIRCIGDVDSDADGLTAWEEDHLGTNDSFVDTDGDGIGDSDEFSNSTDALDYYNGNLPTLSIYRGGDQRTVAGNFLALPVSVRVNATGNYNAPLTFTVTQGAALLAPTNNGSDTPSSTLTVRSTSVIEDANGNLINVASVYVYLPPNANGASVIQAAATVGSSSASTSTSASTLDAATLLPPDNFVAKALSANSVALSWTVSNIAVPTTLQMSVDGGSNWYTVGVVGPGVESASVTDLESDVTVSFRAFAGGIYPAGGGSDLSAPSPTGPPAPTPPASTTSSTSVELMSYPTIKGEQKTSNLPKKGHLGFQVNTHYYLTETEVLSTETQDTNGNWNFCCSTTTVSTYDPITGVKTTQPPQTVNGGGNETELFGGTLTTVSDTLRRIVGTGHPGDGARSTYTDTLSDLYTDEMLRTNGESRLPAFQNVFTTGANWAYIYFNDVGTAYSITKLQYKWHVNPDLTRVIVWDEVFTPFDANGNWNPGTNGENIKHTIKRWAPGATPDSSPLPIDPTQLNAKQNGEYEVVSIQIEPDPGQTDIKGSMVNSIKTDDAQQKHFVTPKEAGKTMRFRATLSDSSNDFGLLYEWNVPSGVTVSGETVTVPRDIAHKYVVELRIKGTSTVVDTLNVWVVWSTGAVAQAPTTTFEPVSGDTTIDGTPTTSARFKVDLSHRINFLFTIQPEGIADTAADIPDLRGLGGLYGVPVPGATLISPAPPGTRMLAGGATAKWDVSRQSSFVVANPARIPRGKFSSGYDKFYSNDPPSGTTLAFPSDPLIGNDDFQTSDEDNNPYQESTTEDKVHSIGEIASTDQPSLFMPEAAAKEGNTIEQYFLAKEFARVQLGTKWYLVSDPVPWKLYMKAQFQSGQWVDIGSAYSPGN